jgi:hypothetical protein
VGSMLAKVKSGELGRAPEQDGMTSARLSWL